MNSLVCHEPNFMGILNVTPDSFSDGGRFVSLNEALAQAERLVSDGATILDVGGESTRPGALPVTAEEESQRVLPVIEAIASRFPVRISIDTSKPVVAKAAIRAGATLINDVTGGRDPGMLALLENPRIEIILMHLLGEPRTMQEAPHYPNGVVTDVKKYLVQRVSAFSETGIAKDRLWIDPGIGFGKTVNHNLDLLRHLDEFQGIGGRVVIGTSRKSFIGKVSGESSVEKREAGTLSTCLWALEKGASVFRVHDVAALKQAMSLWNAVRFGV